MIDFHNHVLPAVDDGSKSLEMSLNMLRHAAEQGITDVVNTVHFQHPKVEVDEITHQRISDVINNLQEELINQDIPIILHSGAEVFFLPNLLDLKADSLATFGHGKYMLIEFHNHHIPETQKQVLFELKMSGVTPIIAHPERYRSVQENITMIYDWLNAGCLVQVDAGSVMGALGKSARQTSEKIIKNNWCQILGSDAHNDRKRNFCLKDAYKIVQGWIGEQTRAMVYDHPQALLAGQPISVDVEPMPVETPGLWKKLIHRFTKRVYQ
ncbi:MAG: CpsB/CapC family capsule biosynthesis tyrosine phosphatase [Candidatus Neomarinimicrobiota bacterium]|nr:CpsB/CapC family capsule biosynthesis tyrosine phosphatase [Candidatus Neomarinimicrobiota bacterium]